MCTCGIPNRADYHLSVVLTVGDETTDTDGYLCAEHTPNVPEGTRYAVEGNLDSMRLARWLGVDPESLIEYTLTELTR